MFGTLGAQEIVVIFILALLLFGPKKLQELGRTIAKAMNEFRRASNELKQTFDREMKSLEQETESLKQLASPYQHDTYNYDYGYESNYEGSYGAETYDSTAATPTTISASATEGAESPAATHEGAPEEVHHGVEIAAVNGTSEHSGTPESAPNVTANHEQSRHTADHQA